MTDDRRRAQWRRYSASTKGRARQARYDSTALGIFSREKRRLRESAARHGARLEMLTAQPAAL